MDPVSAFALACNVLQIVETSLKVLKLGFKLHSHAGEEDAVPEFADIRKITDDLKRTNDRMVAMLRSGSSGASKSGQKRSSNTDPLEDDTALEQLCAGCNDVAKQIIKRLDSYSIPKDHSKRGTAKVLFNLWWDGDELKGMNERLQTYREQLVTRIIVSLRENQGKSFEQILARTGDIQDAIWDNQIRVQESNDNQTELLRRQIDAQPQRILDLLQFSGVLTPGSSSLSQDGPEGIPPAYSGPLGSFGQGSTSGTSILDVVRDNDLEGLKRITRRNPSAIYEFDEESGITALHIACQQGNEEAAARLLKDGARINADDDNGMLPLHYAVQAGNSTLVRLLVTKGGDPSFRNNTNEVPAKYSKPDTEISWILTNGHRLNVRDEDGETALHKFCRLGKIDVVESLLSQGAGYDVRDAQNRGPIFPAASSATNAESTKILELLIAHGADVSATDNDGRTPLICATMAAQPSAAELLLSHGADVNQSDNVPKKALDYAIRMGHPEVSKLLLNHGADVEHWDNLGYCPLGSACRFGRFRIVSQLLSRGANIEGQSTGGWTPIHEAMAFNYPECVRILLSHNPRPNLDHRVNHQGHGGYTPLHVATKAGYRDAIIAYLDAVDDAKAELAKGNVDGWTALHEAAFYGHDEIVKVLIEKGTEVDRTDGFRTPLCLACEHGRLESARLLVDAGADMAFRDGAGMTPLGIALKFGKLKVAAMLREKGAKEPIASKRGSD